MFQVLRDHLYLELWCSVCDFGVPIHEGPGVAASRAEEREKDIFTKTEKWLPAMPLPDFSKWWKSRQEEILCFSEYMSQFRSWIALASDVFAFEIERFGILMSFTWEV